MTTFESATAEMADPNLPERLQRQSLELDALRAENERLHTLLAQRLRAPDVPGEASRMPVNVDRSAGEKIGLIRHLFRGREDVYAERWENVRTGKSGYVPAVAGGWAAVRANPKSYVALSDAAIERHLRGHAAIGIYPLLPGDRCWFLAFDLDGRSWQRDACALAETAHELGVAAAVERSRSGDGAHVWVFFAEAVSASAARQLGALLLRETMRRSDLDLLSYDRLFPNQDLLPENGFGNLIALPLQGSARRHDNSVFLDPKALEPWPDQWGFLSTVTRLTPARLDELLERTAEARDGAVLSADRPPAAATSAVPREIACIVAADVAVSKAGLSPALLAELRHLASLHNPMFYERQRLRLSTHRTPRLIRCYEEDLTHLHLPRGLLEQVEAAAGNAGSRLIADDRRPAHARVDFEFKGILTAQQAAAVTEMLAHDGGVLVAPPGTGKTVMGCAVIADRAVPTLVLAHRKPLLEQWRVQLQELLGLPQKQIGQLGGGRRKRTGLVDLAMIQSLKAVEDLDGFFRGYGLIVIDECHNLPAFSFEACVRQATARHVLGLTATPYRRDGLQEIVTMQCGPIRHQISSADGPAARLSLQLETRETVFSLAPAAETPIQQVFRLLVEDTDRTALVCDDVVAALAEGRRCLVLSQWKEHCELLAQGLVMRGVVPHVLTGGLGKRARQAILEQIDNTAPDQPLALVATGQYLGEGFDCPQLDTLFLAFPVSFKGRLVQYTGRLTRTHDGKTIARVYDYADTRVPVLRAMHRRRLATYKTLGFTGGKTDSTRACQQQLMT